MSRSCEFLDESLEKLLRLRDHALADVGAPDRASRLVAVFEAEARLWSRYYERTRSRPLWRAALSAEAWARHNAAVWRARAVTSLSTPVPERPDPGREPVAVPRPRVGV